MSVSKCVLAALNNYMSELKDTTIKKNIKSFIDLLINSCVDTSGWGGAIVPPSDISEKLLDMVNSIVNVSDEIDEEQFKKIATTLSGIKIFGIKNEDLDSEKTVYKTDHSDYVFDTETSEIKSNKFNGGADKDKKIKSFKLQVLKKPATGVTIGPRNILIFTPDTLKIPENIFTGSDLIGGCPCDNSLQGGYSTNIYHIYEIIKIMSTYLNNNSKKYNESDIYTNELVITAMEYVNGFYAVVSVLDPRLYAVMIYLKCDCPILTLFRITYTLLHCEKQLSEYDMPTILTEWGCSPLPIDVYKIWNLQNVNSTISGGTYLDDSSFLTYKDKYNKMANNKSYDIFVKMMFSVDLNDIKNDCNFYNLLVFEVASINALKNLVNGVNKDIKFYVTSMYCASSLSNDNTNNALIGTYKISVNALPYNYNFTQVDVAKKSNSKLSEYINNIK